jgi:hypothetical protein
MPLIILPKLSLNEFIATCTPLAIIPSLEQEIQQRVDAIASALLGYSGSDNPVENLAGFLRADEDFLGIILALTNLSQEKFLRILTAERFTQRDFEREWSITHIQRKLKHESGFAHRIAQLFIEGQSSPLLAQQVASFYLAQLSLPQNWHLIIRDSNLIQSVIRRKLTGEYTDKKGDVIEAIIRTRLEDIHQKYGIPHQKGQSPMVDKEVDHALPSIFDPYILIMTSYMETTSSSQTARANEQSEMFRAVQANNIRYGVRRVFVNFVDGAGWLARRSDLRKLYDGCDYIVNLNTLDRLEAIICRYMPERFFTRQPRPDMEG